VDLKLSRVEESERGNVKEPKQKGGVDPDKGDERRGRKRGREEEEGVEEVNGVVGVERREIMKYTISAWREKRGIER
jgi:hypothetical protein